MVMYRFVIIAIVCVIAGCGGRGRSAFSEHKDAPSADKHSVGQSELESAIPPSVSTESKKNHIESPLIADLKPVNERPSQATTSVGDPVAVKVDWNERIQRLLPGTTRADVETQLPPLVTGSGNFRDPVIEYPKKGSSLVVYPLDERFQAEVFYKITEEGVYKFHSVQLTNLTSEH